MIRSLKTQWWGQLPPSYRIRRLFCTTPLRCRVSHPANAVWGAGSLFYPIFHDKKPGKKPSPRGGNQGMESVFLMTDFVETGIVPSLVIPTTTQPRRGEIIIADETSPLTEPRRGDIILAACPKNRLTVE